MDILEVLQDILKGFDSQQLTTNTTIGVWNVNFFHKDEDLVISTLISSTYLEVHARKGSWKVGEFTVLKNGGKITNNKIAGPLPDVEIILSRLALRLISEFQN